MDLSLESTLLPESSKSPCTLPKPSTDSTHDAASADAEEVTTRPLPKTQAHPTAGLERSTAPRFNIRSAKSLSLDLGTRNKQKDLTKLLTFFESNRTGTVTENSRGRQSDGQENALGAPTHKVSMVINRNIPDILITSKTEHWPKNPNQAKITATGQTRRNDLISEGKPEPLDPSSQGDQSGQGTGRRGRSEWKRVNFSNRSRSLDWRNEVSDVDKRVGLGRQGFLENCDEFLPGRSESSERGRDGDKGRNMTTPTAKKLDQSCTSVSSRIKEYNSSERVEEKNLKALSDDRPGRSTPVSLQTASRGQSLPSRIKPRLSEGDVSVWGLHQNGTRAAVDMSSNKSILDRIEKLFGSMTSETKRDAGSVTLLKVKRNSLPVEDWSLYWKGDELSHSLSSNNPVLVSESSRQWMGVAYDGGQGGTFPRRYSKGERNNCETGSKSISRNNVNDGNVSTLRSSNIVKAESEWSGDQSPGRMQQTPTSLTERGSRSLDLQPFSVKPRSVINTPKVTSLQQQVQSTVDSTVISARGLPQAIQSKAVTYGGEKEEIKTDVGPDLDPGKEKERSKMGHEGKLGKHEEREQNCREKKEPKPLNAKAICERSPTLKSSGAFDSSAESLPKMKLASVSQAASAALGGVNNESKQDLTDCPGGRPEPSLAIQPTFSSSEPSKWRGHKEKGNGEKQDDVFRLNGTLRVLGNRTNGELKPGAISTSLDNVRSKIDRFESLSQQSQSLPPYHMLRSWRAFPVPDLPKELVGVKKSDSDRTLGGVREQGSVGFGEKQYCKREGGGGAHEGGRRLWEVRSFSVDEVGQRRDGRGREVFGGGINFPQQTKWSAYKEPSYNSTINIEPQRDFKAAFDEPDGSRASQPENKHASGLQGEIPKPLIIKDLMPAQKVNCKNSSGTGSATGITNISGKKACEADVGNKTPTNSSISSPFISSNKSYGTSGSTCLDQASKRGPQASASIQSTREAAPPPVCRVNGIPDASSIPTPESAQSNSLPRPATSSSSKDPQLCSGVTHQKQAKGPKESFGVLARWNSDEDLWGDDDDDEEGTEKGSNYDSDSGESSVTITSNMSQSDRLSFSVSLADLCHFGGVGYTGRDDDLQDMDLDDRMLHRTASLSSDISALSTISIMPADELDRLLEDVRGLGEENLQQKYEDVQVVVLHKEVGCGLGFTVAGGVDQNKPITVHKVFPFGLASQEGTIQEGDQVLSINGTALQNSAHWEALRTLRRARTRGMAVVVLQRGGATETCKNVADSPQAAVEQHTVKKGRMIRVMLNKSSTDLGFSLEGGLGSNTGDRPLTVKKLFQGGPVDDVFPGDELLEIEGQSMQELRRLEAWNLIKKLPPGPVEVVLNRPFRPQ
ncbi:hypothetical protein SKAU_G00222850 [Synaphobranchus kaupii]|uniref:PDZ domain-containing protein n=1 Tax=Synaphobranchus kaupii TaxID=118154 RepID=A0A9Q1FBM6_SYNKA|nr:hypothetical protein SKAU_G00222850 [Synaphobranchus kaupii]